MSMFDADGPGCVVELLWALIRGLVRLFFSPLWWLLETLVELLSWGGSPTSGRRTEKRKNRAKK